MTNVINTSPYLRTSREFPEDIPALCQELSKSYIDTSNSVNERIIGLYPTGRPSITGTNWYLQGNRKQQGLRQVYQFTAAGNIPHGISNLIITQIIDCYGAWNDGTDSYGIIFGSNVAIGGQVSAYVTSTDIVIIADGAAPAITSGTIVLEWISRS